jgi:hypothetical protein
MLIWGIVNKRTSIATWLRDRGEHFEYCGIQAKIPKPVTRLVARCAFQIRELMDHTGLIKKLSPLGYECGVAHVIGSFNIVPERIM